MIAAPTKEFWRNKKFPRKIFRKKFEIELTGLSVWVKLRLNFLEVIFSLFEFIDFYEKPLTRTVGWQAVQSLIATWTWAVWIFLHFPYFHRLDIFDFLNIFVIFLCVKWVAAGYCVTRLAPTIKQREKTTIPTELLRRSDWLSHPTRRHAASTTLCPSPLCKHRKRTDPFLLRTFHFLIENS